MKVTPGSIVAVGQIYADPTSLTTNMQNITHGAEWQVDWKGSSLSGGRILHRFMKYIGEA